MQAFKVLNRLSVGIIGASLVFLARPLQAQTQPPVTFSVDSLLSQTQEVPEFEGLDISPEIIENSPVLQRWLEEIPNVWDDIHRDPSFRTRIRFGYSELDDEAGFKVGVEDVFLGKTGLTVSGSYQGTFDGDRRTWGADLQYYVLPLGSYINFAPVVGYRNIEVEDFDTEGLNVGGRLLFALSRDGAADISLTQSFVSPGSDDEVGITSLAVGYAITSNIRIAADLERHNSREDKENRVGILLEWLP